jgi:hypothetical protein
MPLAQKVRHIVELVTPGKGSLQERSTRRDRIEAWLLLILILILFGLLAWFSRGQHTPTDSNSLPVWGLPI